LLEVSEKRTLRVSEGTFLLSEKNLEDNLHQLMSDLQGLLDPGRPLQTQRLDASVVDIQSLLSAVETWGQAFEMVKWVQSLFDRLLQLGKLAYQSTRASMPLQGCSALETQILLVHASLGHYRNSTSMHDKCQLDLLDW